jgi:hypothetical protein
MYKIVRMYFRSDVSDRTIKTGLTLEEAQKHCRNPETSSSTCRKWVNRKRTDRLGPWFDGFTEIR